MRRWMLGLLIASTAVGCHRNGPLSDPFLRTTVPPPGTGSAPAGAASEPYSSGGGSSSSNSPTYGSPTYGAPGAPSGAPANNYAPPPKDRFSPAGGFHYPQGANEQKSRTGSILAGGSAGESMSGASPLGVGGSEGGLPSRDTTGLAAALAQSPTVSPVGATFKPPIATSRFMANLVGNYSSAGAISMQSPDDAVAGTGEMLVERNATLNESIDSSAANQASTGRAAMAARPVIATPRQSAPPPNKTTLRIISSNSNLAASQRRDEQGVRQAVHAPEASAGAVTLASAESPQDEAGAVTLASAHMPRWAASVSPRETTGLVFEAPAVPPPTLSAPPAKTSSPATSVLPAAGTDFAHGQDYSWLQGQLEYLASSRQWKLRYIPIDGDTDQYGGSVLLGRVQLDGAQAGDVVLAQGTIDANQQRFGFAPKYHLEQLQRIIR